MGNELNKSQLKSILEDDHIIFPGYSKKLSRQISYKNNRNIIQDEENITISKIFEVKLNQNDNNNYIFLEEYFSYLLSNKRPIKFSIKNLEEIIEFIIKYIQNPIDYLLECYHRSIDIIEINSRKNFNDYYKEIHRILAYYIGTLISQPELIQRSINVAKRYESFKKYLKKCDIDELGFFLYDVEREIAENEVSLKIFFGFFFKYLHDENKDKFINFLDDNYHEILGKNMNILKSIFIAFPYTIKIYIDFTSRENSINLGYVFQKENYISRYIDVSPIDGEITPMKKVIDISKPQKETDNIINNYINKLNQYLDEVADFLIIMYIYDPSHLVLTWAYDLIRLNLDKIKMVKNNKNLSTNSFLMNVIIIINKIFFREYEKGIKTEANFAYFLFKVVGNILHPLE